MTHIFRSIVAGGRGGRGCAAVAVCLALTAAAGTLAQEPADPLAAVKEQYGAAAYEAALTGLDQLKPSESDITLRTNIEKYRALCYLALGKKPEAEGAIEQFVALSPFFPPDKLDVAPTIRAAFRDVRRRTLRSVVTKRYEQAKASAVAKAYQRATPQLEEVLQLLDDPDLIAVTDEAWRRDLRTLADGFLDLARANTPPPAPEPKPAPPVSPPPPVQGLLPPVTISERLPPWPSDLTSGGPPRDGVLVISIDEKGNVRSAAMEVSVHPVYDRLLLEAARSWQYRPATRAGVPVPYTKRIRVMVNIREP